MKHLILAALLLTGTAWASEPGEPFDCSDWVAVDPSLRCTVAFTCADNDDPENRRWCEVGLHGNLADSASRLLTMDQLELEELNCPDWQQVVPPGNPSGPLRTQHSLWAGGAGGSELLGYFESRCGVPHTANLPLTLGIIDFDLLNGRLFVYLRSQCSADESGEGVCEYPLENGRRDMKIIVLSGFPALKDYLPQGGQP